MMIHTMVFERKYFVTHSHKKPDLTGWMAQEGMVNVVLLYLAGLPIQDLQRIALTDVCLLTYCDVFVCHCSLHSIILNIIWML